MVQNRHCIRRALWLGPDGFGPDRGHPGRRGPLVGTWVLTLETPQGNLLPMKITLTPDGEQMKFGFDAAGGQFFIEGAATKK